MRQSFRVVTMMFASMLGVLLSSALATDLGQALNFGVLSTGGVVTFGTGAALSGGDIGGTGISVTLQSQTISLPVPTASI
jgi:hypothetical protein